MIQSTKWPLSPLRERLVISCKRKLVLWVKNHLLKAPVEQRFSWHCPFKAPVEQRFSWHCPFNKVKINMWFICHWRIIIFSTDNSRIQAIYKGPFDLWLNVDKLIWRGGKSFHSLDPSLRDGIKDTSLRNASRHIKATKLVCCLMLVCVCISPQ